MTTATHQWAVLLLLAIAAPAALAQSLGDEFIFFVNGTNVMVPSLDGGQAVNDPLDQTSGNKVARFNAGSWTHSGFAWERTEGVDASANVGAAYGESDTLYFRMLSDVANAGVPGISIMLSDATDDSGASRADLEAGTATADHEFRLLWPIPDSLHDGQWHDLAIPLPPATRAALEQARTDGELMDGAENWTYAGAWTNGGFGVGGLGSYDPPESDPLWMEFGWDHLYRIGPFWDNNQASGPIYLDDVYIGGPDTDLSAASDPSAAMSGVTFTTDGPTNVVDWSESSEFGGYNVYASQSPITDVSAEGVIMLASIGFGEDTELRHRFEVPHPSLGAEPIYYAVTSLSPFGVENPDVTNSSGSITNENLEQKAYIRQLTEDEANNLFDDVSNGNATDASFPEDQPVFVLDSSHRSPGDGTSQTTLPDDSDSSGRFKIGYTSSDELVVYGEITDDEVTFAPESETGSGTWNYDSAELVFGHYDVRLTDGGGLLVGSPHQDMERGAEPDYGLRMTALQDANGDIARGSNWIGWSLDTDFENSIVVEKTDTGWKFLAFFALNTIQAPGADGEEADAYMDVPAADEIQFIPLILSINDADGGTRETQIVWSIKPNVTGQWWNTPAMWETVAIAGRDVVGTAVEDGSPRDGFSLSQSVPNPAAGVAELSFSLGAPRHATVEVFNMLGQRVLTVTDDEFAAGPHQVDVDTRGLASGVYVYRLSAGDYVATRRMTVVR